MQKSLPTTPLLYRGNLKRREKDMKIVDYLLNSSHIINGFLAPVYSTFYKGYYIFFSPLSLIKGSKRVKDYFPAPPPLQQN